MEYISVADQKIFNQRYKMAATVVAAFGLTVLVYMLVARIVIPTDFVPGSEKWSGQIYIGVIVLGLIVVVLRRLLLSSLLMKQAASRGAQAVLSKLLIVTVVCAVIAEVVAIAGLVFYLLTGDYQYSWRLGMVSLFLIIYSFPRRREWAHLIASKTGSDPADATRQPARY
ncbi:MAG TPA: hypothetical protein VJ302_24025 [Blastocatellia bacterium]|nr:hypothetical protein [Blastocatellia bacterium]